MPNYQLIENQLLGAKTLSYACQTVLSLVFFLGSTKEIETNYVFLQQTSSNKVPTGTILMVSLLNFLFFADTTLVHQIS